MTASGSASVHVCGLFGSPETTYRLASGIVGPAGDGGGALTDGGALRADASELRFEPGMGSMLWRCRIPSTREALSRDGEGTTAVLFSTGPFGGCSTVT